MMYWRPRFVLFLSGVCLGGLFGFLLGKLLFRLDSLPHGPLHQATEHLHEVVGILCERRIETMDSDGQTYSRKRKCL